MKVHVRSVMQASVFLVLIGITLGPACCAGMSEDFQLGLDYFDAKDYGRAMACFENVVKGDPDLAAEGWHQIGMCLLELGRLDDAIPAFQRALGVVKVSDAALANRIKTRLVVLNIEAKQWGEASAVIQEIALSSPDAAGHLMFRSCLAQRDYERAAAALIYSNLRVPGVAHIDTNGFPQWLLSSEDGKLVSAYLQSFCDAVAQGATITALPVIKADLQAMLEKCGLTDAAAAVVSSAFDELDSTRERACKLRDLAAVYFRGSRFGEAAQVYEEVLKSIAELDKSQQASAHYLLGVCRWKLSEVHKAKICMSEVVNRYPDSPKAKWAQAHLASWSKTGTGEQ